MNTFDPLAQSPDTRIPLTIPDDVREAYTKRVNAAAQSSLIYSQFATTGNPSPAYSVDETHAKMEVKEVVPPVEQYGDFTTVDDIKTAEEPDAVLLKMADILGQQAGRDIDKVTRDSVIDALAPSLVPESGLLDGVTIRRAVQVLQKAYARQIGGYYVAVVSPEAAHDLSLDAGWIPAAGYMHDNGTDDHRGEVGCLYGVRIIENPNAKCTPADNGPSIHSTIIFGANAFVRTPIDIESIVKVYEGVDGADMTGFSGWNVAFGAAIANPDHVIRIDHAVSDGQAAAA